MESVLGFVLGLCFGAVFVFLVFHRMAERRRAREESWRLHDPLTRTSMSWTFTSTSTYTTTSSTYEWLTQELPEKVRKRFRVIRTRKDT